MRLITMFSIVILGSMLVFPYLPSQMIAAEDLTPKMLKQNALSTLDSLDVYDKKDQKRITNAVNAIEKSLDEKLWEDDSSLTVLGKKVFSHEKTAIKELEKIKSIDVSEVVDSLILADKTLAQFTIDLIPYADDKKINKNLDKALNEMQQAQKDVDNNNLDKAIDHYKKAWKLASMGDEIDITDVDSASLDFSNDLIPDYYVQLEYTGDPKKPAKIDYKIQDVCVDLGPKDDSDGGNTYDDTAMKIGVSTVSRAWLIDEMIVWNDWFKKKNNNSNQMIDLIFSPVRSLPHFEDLDGDNVIQGNEKKNSFAYSESISELGGQSGWIGFVYFDAPPGDYLFWTVHPASGIDGCDRLAAQGILVTIP